MSEVGGPFSHLLSLDHTMLYAVPDGIPLFLELCNSKGSSIAILGVTAGENVSNRADFITALKEYPKWVVSSLQTNRTPK